MPLHGCLQCASVVDIDLLLWTSKMNKFGSYSLQLQKIKQVLLNRIKPAASRDIFKAVSWHEKGAVGIRFDLRLSKWVSWADWAPDAPWWDKVRNPKNVGGTEPRPSPLPGWRMGPPKWPCQFPGSGGFLSHGGTPKSSIFMWFSIINRPFGGIFMETPI